MLVPHLLKIYFGLGWPSSVLEIVSSQRLKTNWKKKQSYLPKVSPLNSPREKEPPCGTAGTTTWPWGTPKSPERYFLQSCSRQCNRVVRSSTTVLWVIWTGLLRACSISRLNKMKGFRAGFLSWICMLVR